MHFMVPTFPERYILFLVVLNVLYNTDSTLINTINTNMPSILYRQMNRIIAP